MRYACAVPTYLAPIVRVLRSVMWHIVCIGADSPNGLVGCACDTLPIPARTRWDATVGAAHHVHRSAA